METFQGRGEALNHGRMSAGFWGRFWVWQRCFYGADAFRCSRACGKSCAPARHDLREPSRLWKNLSTIVGNKRPPSPRGTHFVISSLLLS